MLRRLKPALTVAVVALLALAPAARADDDEYAARARAMTAKAIGYLRAKQDPATGGWSVPAPDSKKPNLPAVTALVLNGMLMQPGIDAKDPAVAAGTKYLLNFVQPDGGIYDKILPSYNTSISLSALAKIDTPQAVAAIKPAQDFLRKLQWSEQTDPAIGGPEAARPVDKNHPFYGGIGYGSGGRPDLSNLSLMLQGLHDSGVAADDVAFQRAKVFLARCQMSGTVNDMEYAKGSRQGGFIYSTGPNKDKAGEGESKASTVEETMDDGSTVSRLRAYGSMTYAGFKSYLYADLARDDTRVTEALRWIRENYTLQENPGAGNNGLYYYYVTFARALAAWGGDTIQVASPGADPSRSEGVPEGVPGRNWKHDLIDALEKLQNEDGSFKSVDEKWMENDPVLITAYSLIALEHAAK